jgi:hypothetical protein
VTESRRPEDPSPYGSAVGELHDRALAEPPRCETRGAQDFLEWFDREVSATRGGPALPDGAVRANAAFEDAVPWWRRGSTRALALGASAVAVVFAAGQALPRGMRGRSNGDASPPIETTSTPQSGPPSVSAVPFDERIGDPCRHAVHASGSAPLIDDFEDGNELVALLESRNGYWVVITDSDPAASETVLTPSLLPAAGVGSRSALHVTGGRHTKWGASVQLELGPTCYDASAYRGIAFDVRGPGHLYAGVRSVDAVPVDRGGTCTVDCYQSHLGAVVATGPWSHHELHWSELHQRGTAAPANPRRLSGLEFLVRAEDTPYDLWIDNVTFVR